MSRRARVALLAAGVAAAAAVLVPAAADAHGLVQRTNLPIPEWLFGWAAAIVLVASFAALAALWPDAAAPGSALAAAAGRVSGGCSGRAPWSWACGVAGLLLLVVVIVAGFAGGGSALDNLAPTFILIDFWVGLAFASVLFGDLFRVFSPWRVVRFAGIRPYPERLGPLPGRARAARLHLGRARVGLGRGAAHARRGRAGLHRLHAGGAVRVRHGDLEPPR